MLKDDDATIRTYRVSAAGEVQVDFSLYPGSGVSDALVFAAQYAPNTSNTVAAPTGKFSKIYYHGGTGNNSTTTTFKVTVPATGYLTLDIKDALNSSSVQIKTNGYKGFEYLYSNDFKRCIGVKKGTYTITVKSYADIYQYKVKFTKVKESKYGTKKKKATTIKKKKASKGLIVTNAKKAHWYKFKNPKLQKVKVVIAPKVSEGNSVGGIKISIYDKKRLIGSKILYSNTESYTASLYTLGKKNKLVKGTYYIKVESYKGGNGYFTVKWK